VRDARLNPPFSPLLGHAWLARASAYDAGVGALRSLRGGTWNPADNPFLGDYPWRGVRPDLVPEAPERAVGFAPWFAALTSRTPFMLYWSGMAAVWLVLALVYLGHRLWREARLSLALCPTAVVAARRTDLELATA